MHSVTHQERFILMIYLLLPVCQESMPHTAPHVLINYRNHFILFFVIYALRKITSKNMFFVSVDHNICTSSWYVDFSGATNNCSSRYYHFSSPSQDAFIFLYGIRCALTNFYWLKSICFNELLCLKSSCVDAQFLFLLFANFNEIIGNLRKTSLVTFKVFTLARKALLHILCLIDIWYDNCDNIFGERKKKHIVFPSQRKHLWKTCFVSTWHPLVHLFLLVLIPQDIIGSARRK